MPIKVKVKDIDTSLLDSGGRTLDIKVKSKPGFSTPTQPISRPELTANSYITFDNILKFNLGAIQIDIKGERFEKFIKNNGEVKKTIRKITKYSDIMCFQENFTILDLKPISFDNQKVQKLLLETQLIPRYLSNISIPLVNTSKMTDFRKLINEWVRNAEQFGKGAIPQISLNDDLMALKNKLKIIKELSETEAISIVNVRYANPENYLNQYVELWNMRETNVLFNCYNVPRRGISVSAGLNDSPLLHLQRYGIDTFTYYTVTPSDKYYPKMKSQECPESIDNLEYNWTYHPGGIVLPSSFWRNLPENKVRCGCNICNKQSQDKVINKYCYNYLNEIDASSMDYAAKLHTNLSSEIEYKKIKKYVKSNDMNNYSNEINDIKKDFNNQFSIFKKNTKK